MQIFGIDLLLLLSYIGSIFGAVGTTLIVLSKDNGIDKKKIYGLYVWVVGNGAMLYFTYYMGYYQQTTMWAYYEIINFVGIYQHFSKARKSQITTKIDTKSAENTKN